MGGGGLVGCLPRWALLHPRARAVRGPSEGDALNKQSGPPNDHTLWQTTHFQPTHSLRTLCLLQRPARRLPNVELTSRRLTDDVIVLPLSAARRYVPRVRTHRCHATTAPLTRAPRVADAEWRAALAELRSLQQADTAEATKTLSGWLSVYCRYVALLRALDATHSQVRRSTAACFSRC